MVDPDASHYEGRSVIVGLSDDFEIAHGRRLIEEVAHRAPGLRLIFRQTHSQIVGRALMERDLDPAITAGGFAQRLLSRQVLGEGDYACLLDPASLAHGQQSLSLEAFVAREHLLVSSGGFIGITDEGLAGLGLEFGESAPRPPTLPPRCRSCSRARSGRGDHPDPCRPGHRRPQRPGLAAPPPGLAPLPHRVGMANPHANGADNAQGSPGHYGNIRLRLTCWRPSVD